MSYIFLVIISGIQRTKTDSVQIQSGKHLKVLLLVQELCKLLEHGRQIGKQLIACYRIAINLDLTYKVNIFIFYLSNLTVVGGS